MIKDTVKMNDADLEIVAPIIEETVDRLTGGELKEMLMEIVENEKPEEIVLKFGTTSSAKISINL